MGYGQTTVIERFDETMAAGCSAPADGRAQCASLARGNLLAVADPLSGPPGRGGAAELAMAVLAEWWAAGGAVHPADLEGVVHTASEVVRSRSARRPEGTAPLAASLAVAQIIGGELVVAHAGNVAVLHLGQGVVTRVTRDHTLDRWLREATGIRSEAGETPAPMNRVSQAIGRPAVEAEITRVPLDARDVVVVASPGVTSVLSPADVADLVDGGDRVDATGTALLAVACLRSGKRDLAVALGRVASE